MGSGISPPRLQPVRESVTLIDVVQVWAAILVATTLSLAFFGALERRFIFWRQARPMRRMHPGLFLPWSRTAPAASMWTRQSRTR